MRTSLSFPMLLKEKGKDIKNTYNDIYILEFIFKVTHLSVYQYYFKFIKSQALRFILIHDTKLNNTKLSNDK